MSLPRRRSVLTWPLVLALLAGLGLINWALLTRAPPVESPAASPAVGGAVTTAPVRAPAPVAAPALESFAEILKRPLFSATRRPPGPASAEPEVTPAVIAETPAFRLSGVMIRKKASRALIIPGDGSASVWLAVGDSIGGWELKAISAGSVRLEGQGQVVTLDLYGAAGKAAGGSAE